MISEKESKDAFWSLRSKSNLGPVGEGETRPGVSPPTRPGVTPHPHGSSQLSVSTGREVPPIPLWEVRQPGQEGTISPLRDRTRVWFATVRAEASYGHAGGFCCHDPSVNKCCRNEYLSNGWPQNSYNYTNMDLNQTCTLHNNHKYISKSQFKSNFIFIFIFQSVDGENYQITE